MAKRKPGAEGRSMDAGQFKTICLRLMDKVRDTGTEIIITKRNRPIAKLVPYTDDHLRAFVGRSHGVIDARAEDLISRIDAHWEADADL